MDNLQNNKIKSKNTFSRQFKRKFLLEYSKGKKPNDIFEEFGINLTSDKKYASKMLHKWKNELYKNPLMLISEYVNLDLSYVNEEITAIGNDFENDDIIKELFTKNNKKKCSEKV